MARGSRRSTRTRIRLVHWHAGEAEDRAAGLRAAGFTVESGSLDPAGLRGLRAKPPDAVVVDLNRLPSHGRDVGLALGKLPAGVTLRRRVQGHVDLIVCFVRSRADLARRVANEGRKAPAIWFAWPKKTSGVATDLTQAVVREVGMTSGLVDCKICAIDDTWSALKFTVRKKR